MEHKNKGRTPKLDLFVTAAVIIFYLTAFVATLYLPPEVLISSISADDCVFGITKALLIYYRRACKSTRNGSKRDR